MAIAKCSSFGNYRVASLSLDSIRYTLNCSLPLRAFIFVISLWPILHACPAVNVFISDFINNGTREKPVHFSLKLALLFDVMVYCKNDSSVVTHSLISSLHNIIQQFKLKRKMHNIFVRPSVIWWICMETFDH